MTEKPSFVKVTMGEGTAAHVEIVEMTLLQMTYSAVVILDRVYESVSKQEHDIIAEPLKDILQALTALMSLAQPPEMPSKSEIN